MNKQTCQYKKFYVVDAHFKRSFTGHGPDAIDAELQVEGEFGTVFISYNDFGGERFSVTKNSIMKTFEQEDPEEIMFIEEWEGGLAECRGSKFYLGFKAVSEFADKMAYLNVDAGADADETEKVEVDMPVGPCCAF